MGTVLFDTYFKGGVSNRTVPVDTEVVDDPEKPILCNLNAGHAQPRCIVPFGTEALVDAEKQLIRFSAETRLSLHH